MEFERSLPTAARTVSEAAPTQPSRPDWYRRTNRTPKGTGAVKER